MSEPLIKVSGLKKSRRSNWTLALKPILLDVSFEIPQGEIFGFLGKNGAGKTTTIKSIVGLTKKDAGEILFRSRALQLPNDLKEIGYLPELPYFYDHLSVEESLSFFSALALESTEHAVKNKVTETLELVGLKDRNKSKVKALSKGLQQRLGLAQAIVNKPKLLILDEPFSGLDPTGRAEFREILLNLNQEGTTIFISSHILSDVQTLCQSVSILSGGVVKKSFSLDQRAELFGEQMTLTVQAEVEPNIGIAPKITRKTPHGVEWKYSFNNPEDASGGLKRALKLQDLNSLKILEYQSEARSLEEIFLEVTKESA
jgi:ABC-2 type transport system ATP-binding protein